MTEQFTSAKAPRHEQNSMKKSNKQENLKEKLLTELSEADKLRTIRNSAKLMYSFIKLLGQCSLHGKVSYGFYPLITKISLISLLLVHLKQNLS